jgi:glycosyltransferase involved in cell wall biosynthesis
MSASRSELGFKLGSESDAVRPVLLTIGSLGIGGAQRAVVNLGNALAAAGQPVILASLTNIRSDVFNFATGVTVTLAPARRTREALGWLARLIRAEHPRAVQAFDFEANIISTLALRLAARDRRTRLLWRLSSNYPRMLAERRPLNRAIYDCFFRTLLPQADAVLAPSEDAARALEEVVPKAGHKTWIMPNIVTDWRRAELKGIQPANPPRVISMGRLAYAKNFELLIEAVALLAADTSVELHLLGDGPDRAKLTAEADARGIAERVFIHGFVADPGPALAEATAYAMTSHREGFPNAMAEAMMFGLPTVAVDCRSGPRELLGDIVNRNAYGHLVPEYDAPALAAALREVIAGGGRDPRPGVAAYGAEAVAAQYLDFLGDLEERP